LRRRTNAGLNKGEARNALARAVFFHRLGEIRDRTFENQRYRASGLNLAVAAIILWNTVYLARAVDELRRAAKSFPMSLSPTSRPSVWNISLSTATTFGQRNRSKMASAPYETRAPSSSVRLSVRFRTDSAMTPGRRGLMT
jgi:hypothetical protein